MEPDMSYGHDLIVHERRRQVEEEGWTAEHDEMHEDDALANAAKCYQEAQGPDAECNESLWPWDLAWWKPKDRQRNLVRAGALYLAAAARERRHANWNEANKYSLLAGQIAGQIDTLAVEQLR
jgi:hypothetical protein